MTENRSRVEVIVTHLEQNIISRHKMNKMKVGGIFLLNYESEIDGSRV